MKKLIAILIAAALMFSMTAFVSAAVSELSVQSAQGTAVIDGEKDASYDAATELVFDQSGQTNGGGAVLDTPAGYAYVINDNDYVYIFINVIDDDVDDSSANRYERDSIEVFYMEDNKYQQIRFHIDGHADETKSTNYLPPEEDWKLVLTDTGYAFEFRMPITDVLNNQIEMCLQINSCSGGSRQRCVYISGNTDGDEACQRTTRQDSFDGWWTLNLAGEFEDTRVDPEIEETAEELTIKNYQEIKGTKFSTQLYGQDTVSWGWFNVGSYATDTLGQTLERNWDAIELTQPAFDAENTNNWTQTPNYAIQIGCGGTMAAGESAHYIFTVGDITITADGYDTVVIPAQELDCNWLGKEESWGISGPDSSIELGGTIRDTLGLTIQQFCEEYLPAVTNVNYTVTLDSYNLITLADVEAFEAGLAAAEQEWIDTDATLAEQVEKAQNALASAQGAPDDAAVLANALKDATNAANRSSKARESAGWVEGGPADTYIKETIGSIVDEIQAMADAAAPAEPEPIEDEPASDDTVDTTVPTETSEGGSATGIIVGIIIAVVVIAAVVCAVALCKKKK